jgi:hypothetical protein
VGAALKNSPLFQYCSLVSSVYLVQCAPVKKYTSANLLGRCMPRRPRSSLQQGTFRFCNQSPSHRGEHRAAATYRFSASRTLPSRSLYAMMRIRFSIAQLGVWCTHHSRFCSIHSDHPGCFKFEWVTMTSSVWQYSRVRSTHCALTHRASEGNRRACFREYT